MQIFLLAYYYASPSKHCLHSSYIPCSLGKCKLKNGKKAQQIQFTGFVSGLIRLRFFLFSILAPIVLISCSVSTASSSYHEVGCLATNSVRQYSLYNELLLSGRFCECATVCEQEHTPLYYINECMWIYAVSIEFLFIRSQTPNSTHPKYSVNVRKKKTGMNMSHWTSASWYKAQHTII